MSKLDSKPQIWKLAHDLGLKPSGRPVETILRFVRSRIESISAKYRCTSLTELLAATAAEVGTIFREVNTDADLEALIGEYVAKGEAMFATLKTELRKQDYAITLRRTRALKWEPPFVSVIDNRGDKVFRAYFSKWHELAHLLTLTQQMRLAFRRTHASSTLDPEEGLMDVIAGDAGFWGEFIKSPQSEISFESIERIRQEFCPEASRQASVIGIVKALPRPCILIEARLALRKQEELVRSQLTLADDLISQPIPVLRAVHVTVNQAAHDAGAIMHKQWRVPADSVICQIFHNGAQARARENLDWWTTSGGSRLPNCRVVVEAKKTGESVTALLIPEIE